MFSFSLAPLDGYRILKTFHRKRYQFSDKFHFIDENHFSIIGIVYSTITCQKVEKFNQPEESHAIKKETLDASLMLKETKIVKLKIKNEYFPTVMMYSNDFYLLVTLMVH